MRPQRKRRAAAAPRLNLLRLARLHIRCGRHTTASLARRLEVSIATLMRVLDQLRAALADQGVELVSVRGRSGWHYEIREDARRARERWRRSRVRRLAGVAGGRHRVPLKPEDERIYGDA